MLRQIKIIIADAGKNRVAALWGGRKSGGNQFHDVRSPCRTGECPSVTSLSFGGGMLVNVCVGKFSIWSDVNIFCPEGAGRVMVKGHHHFLL